MVKRSCSEIGKVIRKARVEQGLRLVDLADERISISTISNIERGVSNVKQDKVDYLLKKLNISNEPFASESYNQDIKVVKVRLLGVESLFTNNRLDEAINILNELNISVSHPLADHAFYLKGKCQIYVNKLSEAENNLLKAIEISAKKADKTNIRAASFNDLSIVSYMRCDIEKALGIIEKGIQEFKLDGERTYIWWILHLNKGIYLEEMDKLANSIHVVLDIWKSIEQIDDVVTALKFYWLKAEVLRRMELLKDSEQVALEGIDYARRSENLEEMLELWVVLGRAYMDGQKWDDAEFAFKRALSIKGAKGHKYIIAYACAGRLYTILKRWDSAIFHLQKALSIAEKHNYIELLVRSLQYLGDYYKEKNELDSALLYYQRLLVIAKKYNLKKQEYITLFRLADCWLGKDEEKFQMAIMEMFKVQKSIASEGDMKILT